jgi:hypothetical protein
MILVLITGQVIETIIEAIIIASLAVRVKQVFIMAPPKTMMVQSGPCM